MKVDKRLTCKRCRMGRAGDGGLCLVCRAEDHREAEAAETRTEGPRR